MNGPAPTIALHGCRQLPAGTGDADNPTPPHRDGFLGDRASRGAFRAILDEWRDRVRATGEDPFGEISTDEIGKRKLDRILVDGDPDAAGVVQSTIEDFASELARVAARFLKLKA